MSDSLRTESLQARCRTWAHAQLDLAATATAAEARARMLALLEDDQFIPLESRFDAYRVVVGSATGDGPRVVPPSFVIENERSLLAEIDAFRRDMFQFPTAERVERWQALAERSRSVPRAAARIELLQPALQADLREVANEEAPVRQLAEYAVELFGLPPQAQAMRRRDIVQEMRREREQWESAAGRLRTAYPNLASVDPLLWERIDGLAEDRDWAAARATNLQRGPALRSSSTPDFSAIFGVLRYAFIAVVIAGFTCQILSTRPVPPRNAPFTRPDAQLLGPDVYLWDNERRQIVISPEDRERLLNRSEEELREGGRGAIVILGLEDEWKRRQAERKRLGETGPSDGDVKPPDPPGDATNRSDPPPEAGVPAQPPTVPPTSP